jgi:hypothetical protein
MLTVSLEPYHRQKAGAGLSLWPDQTEFALPMPFSYAPDGRWDMEGSLRGLQADLRRQSGLELDLGAAAREDRRLLRGIQAELVAQVIQDDPEVFSPFRLQGAAPGPGGSLALAHRESGLTLELELAPGSQGLPDASGLLAALEECYRRMLLLDPDQEVFSPAQRQAIRQHGQGRLLVWALEAGAWEPPVELDTEGASWQGDALELRVKVGGLSGRAETERKLLVPVDDAGQPDLANLPELAEDIARQWAQAYDLAHPHKLHGSIVDFLEPQVREYVEALLELRAEFQKAFWEAMNREVEKDRQKVEKLERELEEVERTFKAKPEKLVAIEKKVKETHGSRAWSNMKAAPSKVAKGLWDALGIIAGELMKLPGKVYEGIAPRADDMAKGVEFGFKAAGIVVLEGGLFMATEYVERAADFAATAVGGRIAVKAAKHVPAKSMAKNLLQDKSFHEMAISRSMAADMDVAVEISKYKSLAVDVSDRIKKLRKRIYGK